ncbi:MAG: hypothetical protein ACP8RL_04720 [cyanobacterium endosymbiont of Rhopalodia inflata]
MSDSAMPTGNYANSHIDLGCTEVGKNIVNRMSSGKNYNSGE